VSGVLAGNPFHEEALEVAKAAGADFMVNFVVGGDRGLMGIFAGDLVKAHERGCAFVAEHFKVRVEEPADIVLTSNAGYPLDLNFYQTVKGLVAALPALTKGGLLKGLVSALPALKKDATIIIASRCSEGVGSERFAGLLKELKGMKKTADFLAAHKNKFVADQWEVQELIKVLDKAKFFIYSEGLSKEDAELCSGEKIDSIENALESAFKRHGRKSKVVIIPEGPCLMPAPK
jgi:nickel-dependent lactate racemase